MKGSGEAEYCSIVLPNVQECDATEEDSSNVARNIKINAPFFKSEI
jgi:hypothetical protein